MKKKNLDLITNLIIIVSVGVIMLIVCQPHFVEEETALQLFALLYQGTQQVPARDEI